MTLSDLQTELSRMHTVTSVCSTLVFTFVFPCLEKTPPPPNFFEKSEWYVRLSAKYIQENYMFTWHVSVRQLRRSGDGENQHDIYSRSQSEKETRNLCFCLIRSKDEAFGNTTMSSTRRIEQTVVACFVEVTKTSSRQMQGFCIQDIPVAFSFAFFSCLKWLTK